MLYFCCKFVKACLFSCETLKYNFFCPFWPKILDYTSGADILCIFTHFVGARSDIWSWGKCAGTKKFQRSFCNFLVLSSDTFSIYLGNTSPFCFDQITSPPSCWFDFTLTVVCRRWQQNQHPPFWTFPLLSMLARQLRSLDVNRWFFLRPSVSWVWRSRVKSVLVSHGPKNLPSAPF